MMKRLCSLLLALLLTAGLLTPAALADVENMQVSEEGSELIKDFEGYRRFAYEDGGKWYIGYGSLCEKGDYPDGISEKEAEDLMVHHLMEIDLKLNAFLKKYDIHLEQHQYDALASMTYNLGTSWINPAYRLCQYLMNGIENYTEEEVVNAIASWCHIGRTPLHGLAVRRLKEAFLFLYGDYDNDGDEAYTYVHFDVTAEEIDHSTVFYPVNTCYGELPTPTHPGRYFRGWYTESGARLTGDDIAQIPITVSADWGSSPVSDTGVQSTDWDNPYSDLKEGEWYYSYIKNLTIAQKVDGYPDGTFQPGKIITAGEALKLILLTAGFDEQPAIDSHWASGYSRLAQEQGYLLPEDLTNLDAPIRRELIAQLAAQALHIPEANNPSPFADCDSPYVRALYEAGIVTGSYNEQNKLVYLPQTGIIRSELCALVWRMLQYVPGTTRPEPEPEPEPPTPEELGYIEYRDQKLPLLYDVEKCPYEKDLFRLEGSFMHYDDPDVDAYVGIDVSSYQGNVDWRKVKDAGIEFVMLRVGFRGYTQGTLNLDEYFIQNAKGASQAGLKVGCYFFSTATNEREAIEEAEYLLDAIEGLDIDYPVVYDWEANSKSYRNYGLEPEILTDAAIAFCERVAEEGYIPMVYFNLPTGYLRYQLDRLTDYDFWFAYYPNADSMYPTMYYNYHIWQYSDHGNVNGIDGRVDMNIAFKRW